MATVDYSIDLSTEYSDQHISPKLSRVESYQKKLILNMANEAHCVPQDFLIAKTHC